MLICPKCKNEYRDGMKICPDCKCELTENPEEDRLVSLVRGNELVDEDVLLRLRDAMEQGDGINSPISGVEVRYNVGLQEHELLVRERDAQAASKIAQGFFMAFEQLRREEMLKEMTRDAVSDGDSEENGGFADGETGEAEESSAEGGERVEVSNAFVDSGERARENRSAMWSLFIAGGLGLAFVALGLTGILPIRVGNAYFFYGVMSVIFLVFLVMGFVSMRSARSYSEKAVSENTLRETLTKWCRENLFPEEIDRVIHADQEPSEELLYFKRYDYIKTKLNRQFVNLDPTFLERFIDETVYEMVYPQDDRE